MRSRGAGSVPCAGHAVVLDRSGRAIPETVPKEKPEARSPAARVDDANKAATPTEYGYINAIQVYPFSDGALYRRERMSDIALEPGEKLTSVSAGDTVRWTIGDAPSGAGDGQRVHVLVKPFAPGLETNLVITTDRRSYHLQLLSAEKASMAAISWIYPQGGLLALRHRNAEATMRQLSALLVGCP